MDYHRRIDRQVAHDFNNLLMAVLGSSRCWKESARRPSVPPPAAQCSPGRPERRIAGQAAARLFPPPKLKPESVDIGELVVGVEELLRRALGIASNSSVSSQARLSPVLVDANQLELALLNVALNARDAMPDGGRLMISAEETEYAGAADFVAAAGRLCAHKNCPIRVWAWMKPRGPRRPNRFSPPKAPAWQPVWVFSVVHGIAAQSGGLLHIESAPNVGTTIELWLPRSNTRSVSGAPRVRQPRSRHQRPVKVLCGFISLREVDRLSYARRPAILC